MASTESSRTGKQTGWPAAGVRRLEQAGRRTTPKVALAGLLLAALVSSGCLPAARWAGIRLLYEEATLSEGEVIRDLAYRNGTEADPRAHRLDLFLPPGSGWPTLIFVHGGGWTEGDKALVVGGADVYGNIGRFYAERGVAVAAINYRLQPAADWRQQVSDVAAAVAWVHREIGAYGGNPDALFLSGHSAGAQLAARAALDRRALAAVDLSPELLCGVIPVSGAGYDMADEETYRLGAERPYYEARFRNGDPGDGWLEEASTVPLITPQAPPFLLLYSRREWPALGYQNRLFDAALEAAGVASRLVEVPGESHSRMVLAMSRPGGVVSPALLDFLRTTPCPRSG